MDRTEQLGQELTELEADQWAALQQLTYRLLQIPNVEGVGQVNEKVRESFSFFIKFKNPNWPSINFLPFSLSFSVFRKGFHRKYNSLIYCGQAKKNGCFKRFCLLADRSSENNPFQSRHFSAGSWDWELAESRPKASEDK